MQPKMIAYRLLAVASTPIGRYDRIVPIAALLRIVIEGFGRLIRQ
jgi:hypothetical protein